MTDISVYFIFLVVGLFLLDYYVYVHWKRLARAYRKLRWTLPVYGAALVTMPLTMPAYFAFSRWWEVEPKLVRALFFGVWVTYYLPKALIALVLLFKDLAHYITWLFRWFQLQLSPTPIPSEAAVTVAPSLDLTDMKRMGRRAFMRQMGWSAGSVPFVITGYGVFRSLYDFQVHRVIIPIPSLPPALDGLTIAQLSDLHAGSFFSERPMLEAASLTQALRPDLIVITGDYVNRDDAEFDRIAPGLRLLKAELGVYGSLGNHDHYANVDAVAARVRASNVDLLVNANRTFDINGARLNLIGTDNTGFNQHFADMPKALAGLAPPEPGAQLSLLLAHDPTYWDAHIRQQYPFIDLMLSGHTHGGQIGLELGPLRWSLARVAYSRWAGLYAEERAEAGDPQFLYVNRGLSTVGPPLRLGIRPEITLLTLRRTSAA
ncbi:MAG: metallophosphoesterase [Rhodothermales bacterium]|nr:metallophosphoesterase [Rhodothermales bacterium]